jgi:hypothetical protein
MTPQRIIELRRKASANAGCHGATGAVSELANAFERLRAEVRNVLVCEECATRGVCDEHGGELRMLLDHPEPGAIAKIIRERP